MGGRGLAENTKIEIILKWVREMSSAIWMEEMGRNLYDPVLNNTYILNNFNS